MRVLLAEDDTRLAEVLEQALTEAGWSVEVYHDGGEAYRAAVDLGARDTQPFDVLLLDWMLPTMDGLTLCRRVRALGINTPVLMLTARSTTRDLVAGLEGGADDYLRKPYELEELLSRLRALYRRSRADPDEPAVTVGELTLADIDSLRLLLSGDSVNDWHLLNFADHAEVDRFLRLNEFDPENDEEMARLEDVRSEAVESALRERAPDLPWEAINQAAVHLWYPPEAGVEPLASVEEAVAKSAAIR